MAGMISRRWWLTAFAALMLTVIAAGTAVAYSGEVAASVSLSRASGTLKCGQNITVSALVQDKDGKPIEGQPVAWSWISRVSKSDVIKKTSSTTNASGIAHTTVNLACVPGSRRLGATADGIRGPITLNVTAAGLPRTSTALTGAPLSTDPMVGTLLALLALMVGGGLVLRGALTRR